MTGDGVSGPPAGGGPEESAVPDGGTGPVSPGGEQAFGDLAGGPTDALIQDEGPGEKPWLRVTEIFHSIQGESTWAGLPCTFVRLTGCPLRCVWCDTAYAFHGGERLSLDEIVDEVREMTSHETHPSPLVEVTGGEPLVHRNAFLLTDLLVGEGFTVLVETSGSRDVSRLDRRVHKIMDLKCPGSGEAEKNLWSNLEHLTRRDEVKFVVAGPDDWAWAAATIRERGLARRVREGSLRALLVSPVWGAVDLEELAALVLESGLPVRLQVQVHKVIWGADQQGV